MCCFLKYFLYYQISTSAVLQLEFVMSMPTARILLELMFVPVKMDSLEMVKLVKVRGRREKMFVT